jgi:hypothetical protein
MSDDVATATTDGKRLTFVQRSEAITRGRYNAFLSIYAQIQDPHKFAELFPDYLIYTSQTAAALDDSVHVVLKATVSNVTYEPIPVGKFITARGNYSNFNGFEQIGNALYFSKLSSQPTTVTALYIRCPVEVTYTGSGTDIPEKTYMRSIILQEAVKIAEGMIQTQ